MSAEVEAAATASEPIVGIHSKLPKIGLEVGKTYQLLPLFIELGASDRKRLFFTVCYREYLAKLLIKAAATVKTSSLVDRAKLQLNGIYLTKYDEEWFRGRIVDISEASSSSGNSQHYYLVDYFDFGHRRRISYQAAEYSFRYLEADLTPVKLVPAAIRVQLKNIPSYQQYNYLKRYINENAQDLNPVNIYVFASGDEEDGGAYQVQFDAPK